MVSPQGHWDWPCWDDLTGIASGWPGQDGTGVASLGQHWGGLPSTCDLSMSPHDHPIQGWGDPKPSLLPRRCSGEPGTEATRCGAGALHDGGFGLHCFGGSHGCWRPLLRCWPVSQNLPVHQLLSSPQISKPISCLQPFEEEEGITQNPEVSMVYKVAWPDWKGITQEGKEVVLSLY